VGLPGGLFNMSLSLSRDLTEAGLRHGIGLNLQPIAPQPQKFTLLMSVVADVVEPALGECGRNCLVRVPNVLGDARIILSARA